jgi:hypothetical protein
MFSGEFCNIIIKIFAYSVCCIARRKRAGA